MSEKSAIYQEQVNNFKTPHGVKIGTKLYAIRFLVSGYNCSVKFCGRLTTHVFKGTGEMVTYLDDKEVAIINHHKKEIIQEFSDWASEKTNFPALMTDNPFFPWDGGLYGVNVFLYADDIAKEEQDPWYSNMSRLITELDKYGWKVNKGVEFYNCTYNSLESASRRKASRIYQLTPPKYVPLLIKR